MSSTSDDKRGKDEDSPGMALMLKMGFKPGTGLGKQGTGITEPIQVKPRAEKSGLGADKKSFVTLTTEEDSSEEEDLSWIKDTQVKKSKREFIKEVVDELRAELQALRAAREAQLRSLRDELIREREQKAAMLYALQNPWEKGQLEMLSEDAQLSLLGPLVRAKPLEEAHQIFSRADLHCRHSLAHRFWYPGFKEVLRGDPIGCASWAERFIPFVPNTLLREILQGCVGGEHVVHWLRVGEALGEEALCLRLLTSRLRMLFDPKLTKPSLELLKQARLNLKSSSYQCLLETGLKPLLRSLLQDITIDACNQDTSALAYVLPWRKHLDLNQLFKDTLFTKLNTYLQSWMHEPSYEDIMRWYLGWRALLRGYLEDELFRPLLDTINANLETKE